MKKEEEPLSERLSSLIDEDQVAHPHLLVQKVAAVRLVTSRRRDQWHDLRFVRTKLDFIALSRAAQDMGVLENPGAVKS